MFIIIHRTRINDSFGSIIIKSTQFFQIEFQSKTKTLRLKHLKHVIDVKQKNLDYLLTMLFKSNPKHQAITIFMGKR